MSIVRSRFLKLKGLDKGRKRASKPSEESTPTSINQFLSYFDRATLLPSKRGISECFQGDESCPSWSSLLVEPPHVVRERLKPISSLPEKELGWRLGLW